MSTSRVSWLLWSDEDGEKNPPQRIERLPKLKSNQTREKSPDGYWLTTYERRRDDKGVGVEVAVAVYVRAGRRAPGAAG